MDVAQSACNCFRWIRLIPFLSLDWQWRGRIVDVERPKAAITVGTGMGLAVGLSMIRVRINMDVQVAGVPEQPGSVLLMLLERTMAQKMNRQLTHRGAARSVTGMAAV